MADDINSILEVSDDSPSPQPTPGQSPRSTFILTSIMCIIHAAALLMLAFLLDRDTILSFGVWFWCVAAWPLWYIVVPLASRGYKWRSFALLVLGTVIWAYPGFLAAATILVAGLDPGPW